LVLLTVATQSVAVVAALLLGRSDSDLLAFPAISAFTLGIVVYLIVMTNSRSSPGAPPLPDSLTRVCAWSADAGCLDGGPGGQEIAFAPHRWCA
jgi:hypothetical protein